MKEKNQPLFNIAYLRSIWTKDYEIFKESPEANDLDSRLKNWSEKDFQKETASEGEFVDQFFKQTWGYTASGGTQKDEGYTLWQQYSVKGAGQRGGTGEADGALGYFGLKDKDEIPQVLCEFKDTNSGLDKQQNRKGNKRSPVDQCLDYLRESRTGLISSILPTWGLVTDMNEFRLYLYGNKAQYQRFVINPVAGDAEDALLGDTEKASFNRFVFYRMFHRDWILSTSGKSQLEKLLGEQLTFEQTLEDEFYLEYKAFRETIYLALKKHNPKYAEQGRLRWLVKYTQRILDRCLFILYCEDMGEELSFPPNVLRNILQRISSDEYYDPAGQDAWFKVKQLFVSMRDGSPFGSERINRFNGGLFAEDAEMDALVLPNSIFCEKNQGESGKRMLSFPKTLLYFSAKYNFGASGSGEERTLTLTAMGRIFEQSITELEVMEANAEGRESITLLSKRKRDGVYYTPEWVTHYIVEETIGARLAEIRKELEFDDCGEITDEMIKENRKDGRKHPVVDKYKKAVIRYRERLEGIKIVDPACGSGAFLIQAFKHLYSQHQWVAGEMERLTGTLGMFDSEKVMRNVLSNNLYGVDINAESVEITRLALWLHTALPDRPLTSLDQNIRCGNSLIGHDFYEQLQITRELFTDDELDRVNTFDWYEAFPEVFPVDKKGYLKDGAGFDCVIGNPPYVKLQHFRKVQEDVARYLVEARNKGGKPVYESTQTGNFDLYLPFIERGVELLNPQGKMGYIAPNVWMVNEYGKGLRQKFKRTRRLDRWIDFKSYQVFSEAITYTALQFFTGFQQNRISCVFAPTGKLDISTVNWDDVKDSAYYKDLPEDESWVLMPNAERSLYEKLKNCRQLGDNEITSQIFQGIKTSADKAYVLEKVNTNNYLYSGGKNVEQVVIEDSIMRKLASGKRINRYEFPVVDVYLLFPYDISKTNHPLYTKSEMKDKFPYAWEYLCQREKELRARENYRFNDENWYCFSRPQNLDKQPLKKLAVAGTAPELRVTCDEVGELSTLGGRVYSILPTIKNEMHFLLGILNSPVPNFIFRRIARPKSGGFFDAETQFLAPLPIPNATDKEKAEVGERAKHLQELHTKRRDLMLLIDKRLEHSQCEDDQRTESWIWSEIKEVIAFKKQNKTGLKGKELTAWAKAEREKALKKHLDELDALLQAGAKLTAVNEYGELKLLANDIPLISTFLDAEMDFIAAQWRHKGRQTNVTEKFDGKRLLNIFLKLRRTENEALKDQVIKLDKEVQELDREIDLAEKDMNQLTYKLYMLTEAEIKLVELG